MQTRVLSIGLAAAIGVSATAALAVHNHPLKTIPMKVPLVRAYQQCTSPSTSANAPTGWPACAPISPGTATLEFGPVGHGFLKFTRVGGAANPDIKVDYNLKDVRDVSMVASPGTPYGGQLRIAAMVRISNSNCAPPSSGTECTFLDLPVLDDSPTCAAGKCIGSFRANANTLYPSMVQPGFQANVEIFNVYIYRLLTPGVPLGTAESSPSFTPGLYVP